MTLYEAYKTCNKATIVATLPPTVIVPDHLFWHYYYCTIVIITTLVPPPEIAHFEEECSYSWWSLRQRADLWLSVNRVKLESHMFRFRLQGHTYKIPKEMIYV